MEIGIKICEKCGKSLPLTEQNYYKSKMYCNNCFKDIKIDISKSVCIICGVKLTGIAIHSYYGADYCSECLEIVKEERKQAKKPKQDDNVIEMMKKQIETMQKDQEFLKDLILKSIGGTPESQKMSNKYKNLLRKALTDLLNNIAMYSFSNMIDDVVKKFGFDDLYNVDVEYEDIDKKGNKKIRKSNFFFTRFWSNSFDPIHIIDEQLRNRAIEISKNKQKTEAAEFINRIKRGEKSQLVYGFNALMGKIKSFTNIYIDLLDKIEEEENKK